MELNSVKQFNELTSSLESKTNDLNREKAQLERQKGYFLESLERSTTIDDKESIKKSKQGLEIINKKLQDVHKKIDELNLEPIALAVFDECESRLGDIQEQMTNQWEVILNARIKFFEELKRLGELKIESWEVANQSNGAAKVLRRNPLFPLSIGGQHIFPVSLNQVNDLIKAW